MILLTHPSRLSSEIRAYEAYMRLTPAEEAAAQLVMSDVKIITRRSLRNAPLTMLGSRSTGLATPLSDFDVTFSVASSDHGSGARKQSVFSRPLIREAVGSLRKIEKDLRNSIKVQGTELVIARIPIIETKHRGTGFKIQIQTMAPHQPAQEYSAAYLNELPSLRPLFVVLRYCLEIRGLTTVYEGGLGSYTLLMMIVTALKHSSGTFASDDLAGQLLYILYFYGSTDLYRYGFSANPPRVFDKLKEGWTLSERLARSQDPQLRGIDEIVRERNRRKPYLLSLQDPANDFNDLGKNSYAIKHIQAVFNNARQSILDALEQGAMPPENHAQGGMWSYMDGLVRADYKAFEANRSKVERFANDPLSKDYDYSTERITEDFQRRVHVYKKHITVDEYGVYSTLHTLQLNRLKRQEQHFRRRIAGLIPVLGRWSTSYMALYLHFESNATILSLWVECNTIMERLARKSASKLQTRQIPDSLIPNQDKWTTDYLDLLVGGLISIRTLWWDWYGIKKILARTSASTEKSPFVRKQYSDDMISLVHRHLLACNDHLWDEWTGIKWRFARDSASSKTLRVYRKLYKSDIETHISEHLKDYDYHLWDEWYGIKGRLALESASSKALPVFHKNYSIGIGQEVTAPEIARAQETKQLTTRTADLEKRFPVSRAKTKNLRTEGCKIRLVSHKDLCARWQEKLFDLQRELLDITIEVAMHKKDSGVAYAWALYDRLRPFKNKYLKEFNDITRRLNSLNGQESAMADTQDPLLFGDRRQLHKRVTELKAEIREIRQREVWLQLQTFNKRNLTDAEYCRTFVNLEESQNRRGELSSEITKTVALWKETHQQKRIEYLEEGGREIELASKEAARSTRSETPSPDPITASVIDIQAAHLTITNEEVQPQEAVSASASEKDTAETSTARWEAISPQARRPSRTRAESRIVRFRSLLLPKKISKPRPFAVPVTEEPSDNGPRIRKISLAEDSEPPSVTNKPQYYRKPLSFWSDTI